MVQFMRIYGMKLATKESSRNSKFQPFIKWMTSSFVWKSMQINFSTVKNSYRYNIVFICRFWQFKRNSEWVLMRNEHLYIHRWIETLSTFFFLASRRLSLINKTSTHSSNEINLDFAALFFSCRKTCLINCTTFFLWKHQWNSRLRNVCASFHPMTKSFFKHSYFFFYSINKRTNRSHSTNDHWIWKICCVCIFSLFLMNGLAIDWLICSIDRVDLAHGV